jgi:hypothetical protein
LAPGGKKLLPWIGLLAGALVGALVALASVHHMTVHGAIDRPLVVLLFSVLSSAVGWLAALSLIGPNPKL